MGRQECGMIKEMAGGQSGQVQDRRQKEVEDGNPDCLLEDCRSHARELGLPLKPVS